MFMRKRNATGSKLLALACLLASDSALATAQAGAGASPADAVNPLIGSTGGNTYPVAVMPFGMLRWGPENTRGHHTRTASPSGCQFDARQGLGQ